MNSVPAVIAGGVGFALSRHSGEVTANTGANYHLPAGVAVTVPHARPQPGK